MHFLRYSGRAKGGFAGHEGHRADGAFCGREALRLCRENAYDAIILDVMLPDMDGFSVCRELRALRDTPVLMLSARGEEYDKLTGFDCGADDYKVKPFSPCELMASIRVIVSRHGMQQAPMAFSGLVIDPAGRTVTADGMRLALTAKEYDLLLYLAVNRGVALTREQILCSVWGYDTAGDARTVDWQIKPLRGKPGAYRRFIVTLRGVGYCFDANS